MALYGNNIFDTKPEAESFVEALPTGTLYTLEFADGEGVMSDKWVVSHGSKEAMDLFMVTDYQTR